MPFPKFGEWTRWSPVRLYVLFLRLQRGVGLSSRRREELAYLVRRAVIVKLGGAGFRAAAGRAGVDYDELIQVVTIHSLEKLPKVKPGPGWRFFLAFLNKMSVNRALTSISEARRRAAKARPLYITTDDDEDREIGELAVDAPETGLAIDLADEATIAALVTGIEDPGAVDAARFVVRQLLAGTPAAALPPSISIDAQSHALIVSRAIRIARDYLSPCAG